MILNKHKKNTSNELNNFYMYNNTFSGVAGVILKK